MSENTLSRFEVGLFNLITMEGNTGLLFSKRNEITQEMLDYFDLLVLEYREKCLIK